jgi:hypothetical protein
VAAARRPRSAPASAEAAADEDREHRRELVQKRTSPSPKGPSSLSRISSTLPQQPYRSRQMVMSKPKLARSATASLALSAATSGDRVLPGERERPLTRDEGVP